MQFPLKDAKLENIPTLESTVDVYTLSDEVHYGFKLFRELLSQQRKPVCNLLQTEPNWNDAKLKCKTLPEINEWFNEDNYSSITHIISDLRNLFECYYKFFGYDHYVIKHVRSLEMVMEQKVALLPRAIQNHCTLESTNIFQNREHLNANYNSGSRKRLQPMSECFETPIMTQIRSEVGLRNKQLRKHQGETRKINERQKQRLQAKLLEQLVLFEERIISLKMMREIKNCWQLPCVGMFVCMLKDVMNISAFNYTEFELGSLFMDKSVLYAKVFTSLLSSPSKRKRFTSENTMSYREWSVTLDTKISRWFLKASTVGGDKAAGIYGLDKSFFEVFANSNPLHTANSFLDLSLEKRMTILKALCEAALDTDEAMCAVLSNMSAMKRQDLYLGQDIDNSTYHFFPQFAETDIRIYRQNKTNKDNATRQSGITYELVAWNLQTIEDLATSLKLSGSRRGSHTHSLAETLDALHAELSTSRDLYTEAHESGKLSIMKEYYWPHGQQI